MWKFGIYADGDSFFVGGKAGHWIGVHADLPWTQESKQFGAPYALFLHWFPGKVLEINLGWLGRFFGEPRDILFGDWHWVERGEIRFRCSVDGCGVERDSKDSDDLETWMIFEERLHHRDGRDVDLGTHSALLCNRHAELMERHKVRVRLVAVEEEIA